MVCVHNNIYKYYMFKHRTNLLFGILLIFNFNFYINYSKIISRWNAILCSGLRISYRNDNIICTYLTRHGRGHINYYTQCDFCSCSHVQFKLKTINVECYQETVITHQNYYHSHILCRPKLLLIMFLGVKKFSFFFILLSKLIMHNIYLVDNWIVDLVDAFETYILYSGDEYIIFN